MNKLLIKIPTRERGFDWLPTYLDNITNLYTELLISLDEDYPETPEYMPGIERCHFIVGKSDSKIHAINRDIPGNDFDILLVGSDDMIPQIRGFDQIILDDMKRHFPDGDGVLWYDTEDQDRAAHIPSPRGGVHFLQKGICMMAVMGRKYYDRFGYVYHPSYKSFWCDNEYTDIARMDKKIQWIGNRILEHYHPAWNTSEEYGKDDELYNRNNHNWNHDRNNYNQRKRQGFPTN